MARYLMTWNHPKKSGEAYISGDLIDCSIYLVREGIPLKDVSKLTIEQVKVVKKGTMFDGTVVEKPT